WSASSVGYTWLNPNNGSGQVQVYAHIQGNKGTWGDFATTWAELADNQCIEIVYTGTFAGVTKDAVSFDSRVWNETTKSNDFIVSASDNEIVVRLAGPLTSKLMDPNLGLFFAENSLTAISAMEDTSVVVTVLEEGTEPTEPTTESTEPIVDPTGTEPTTESTEPIVDPTGTEPSESTPSQSETTPSESKTEPSQPSVILGDANGDGAVNMKDVLNARKYLAGIDTEIDMVAADVNCDGAVNMKDVLQLRKFLAGLIESFGE
ncbi:MAG: dockerin type I domain-containing protein, partial [Clostridia bacterium]|nr:dockerin type I domain-containing protein [Clostridia bacterium]